MESVPTESHSLLGRKGYPFGFPRHPPISSFHVPPFLTLSLSLTNWVGYYLEEIRRRVDELVIPVTVMNS